MLLFLCYWFSWNMWGRSIVNKCLRLLLHAHCSPSNKAAHVIGCDTMKCFYAQSLSEKSGSACILRRDAKIQKLNQAAENQIVDSVMEIDSACSEVIRHTLVWLRSVTKSGIWKNPQRRPTPLAVGRQRSVFQWAAILGSQTPLSFGKGTAGYSSSIV